MDPTSESMTLQRHAAIRSFDLEYFTIKICTQSLDPGIELKKILQGYFRRDFIMSKAENHQLNIGVLFTKPQIHAFQIKNINFRQVD